MVFTTEGLFEVAIEIIIIIRTIVYRWFLLAMSYFTVPTFNKVINK